MLIRTERGRFEEVSKRLRQVPGVMGAFPVLGRFDIVVDIEAADSRHLGRVVIRVSRLAGVVFTETLPEVET
jgi:uncharacterized protein with GYD domain